MGALWKELPVEPVTTDFGDNPFDPNSKADLVHVHGRNRKHLREAIRSECKNEPGVYGMLDADGVLIYVGKSKQLRTRILSYFTPGQQKEKSGRIIRRTHSMMWEPAGTEFAALLRELHLIQTRRPAWNVKDMPKRMRANYVCIGRPKAPGVYVTNRQADHVTHSFGPLRGSRRVKAAVEALNRHCRLRDCPNSVPMRFTDQRGLFDSADRPGCLRLEMGTCLGPCVGACSRRSYTQQVRQAQAFLEGEDLSLLDEVASQMQTAAAGRLFELAARLRDELESLTVLREILDRLQTARQEFTFIYPHGAGEHAIWYLIRGGQVASVVAPPTDADSATAARKEIDRIYHRRLPNDDLTMQRPDTLMLVSSWFHRKPQRLDNTLSLATARRRCTMKARQSTESVC
ncbi:GIY-YIG nuclease family protein [Thalassoroseus pseudoceratinae]|uniref:GIY-YIG nuclease family protein n=1 Tax=Thalassoroseus pseudoceratinae TaxID=2713176 RepID=UPI0014229AEF|nr:GIY-YIG nuclease family protein [Thalassoroseus pseudoceratinae]